VLQRWKPIVACLCSIMFAAAIGCNRSGDGSQPSAAIEGSAKDGPSTDGMPPPPKPNSDSQHPVVLIQTSLGDITVELDRRKALLTVDNFLAYVKSSFYDQTIIHQVYKDQAIMAGGYGTNGMAKPARTAVRNEADNGMKNLRYTIAMTRWPDSVHSATSQFFINVADNPSLDYKDRTPDGYGYCVFGKVIEGMDVVDAINRVEVHDAPRFDRTPKEQVVVKSIRLIR
jgi:cyclophilin family peptidyl-prolyl cis-trans isomerase